ncbi:MAG: toll/interleukin-1 receptor domain-containing protein [Candidatus Thiodiazotropha sp.]
MNIIQTLTALLTEGETILRLAQPGPRQIKWKKWSDKMAEIARDNPEFKPHHLSLTYRNLKSDLEKIREILKHHKQKMPTKPLDPIHPPSLKEQNKTEPTNSTNGHVNVFISYKNQDTALAKVVKEQLTTLNFDRVKVFLAHDDIRAGDNWKEQLFGKLRQSDWLIMIHTDPDYDWEWPNREAVMFETMHMNLNRGDHRLCCLHATDNYPKTLNDFQHYKVDSIENKIAANELSEAEIETLYKKSRIYQFLENFISYPDDNPIISDKSLAQSHMIKAASEIIKGFMHAQNDKVVSQHYYPPRLEIVLPPPDKLSGKPEISDTSSVTLGNKSRLIFSNEGSDFSWDQFRQERIDETENPNTPRWLLELEDRINIAAQGTRIPEPSFGVLYSKHLKRFMRPVLTRQEIYASNKRKFYVLLLEQPLMDFSGHREMGKLLAMLIFGMRFRFDYLAPFFQAIVNIDQKDDYEKFIQDKKDMITIIESEAEQHGLTRPDKVVPIFHTSDQNKIRGLFHEWFEIRSDLWEMFEHPPTKSSEIDRHREQILEIHRTLHKMNSIFLKYSIKRYSELLNHELTIDTNPSSGTPHTNTRTTKLNPGKKSGANRRQPTRTIAKKTAKKVSKKSPTRIRKTTARTKKAS